MKSRAGTKTKESGKKARFTTDKGVIEKWLEELKLERIKRRESHIRRQARKMLYGLTPYQAYKPRRIRRVTRR